MSFSYDEVPYTSFPYHDSHPDHLGVIGELFHLSPARTDECRVLEIGCSSGGNLLPMAQLLPRARFLGIDLAATAIAEASEAAHALGLSNVRFEQHDIMTLGEDLGEFDYIIAHGVYSWVPDAVKERLLDVYGRHLAPHGIGYLSHNVKPGWSTRSMVREMMLFHTDRTAPPARQVGQARALIDWLVASAKLERWRDMLQHELEDLHRSFDWLVYHDLLAEVNDGCWFHELSAKLPPRGLQFLADSDLGTMLPTGLDPEVTATLERLAPDIVSHEQYLDFLRRRAFRMTLVCRADAPIDRSLKGHQLATLHVSARASDEVSAAEPITLRALAHLGSVWPRALAFRALVAAAGGTTAEDEETLSGDLLQCFFSNVVELHRTAPPCAATVGERPLTAPFARRLAARGHFVTNLRHENGRLDAATRRVLQACDGTRDRAALETALRAGEPAADVVLEDVLEKLLRSGYLWEPRPA